MNHIAFYIANINGAAGTERCVSMISARLVEDYQVSIISFNEGLNPFFSIDSRIKLFSLEGEKIKKHKTLPIVKRLLKLQKMQRFDCIIVVDICIFLPIAIMKLFTRIKTIAWEHFNCSIKRDKIGELSRKLAVHYADKLVVLGKRDLSNYKKRFPKLRKIECIYNPIAFEVVNAFDVKNKNIIAVGRLEMQKGFDLLIEAWKIVEPHCRDWKLFIYGEGTMRESLQQKIDDFNLSHVFLSGFSENIQAEMKKSGIFVLSSRYEGFGLVLLEAQAFGLPIVSFDCREGPAEIVDDGINGFLVEPENVEQLAQKMIELINDDSLRIFFSENSQKDLYRFNIDDIIKQWRKMLNEVLIEN